MKNENIDKIRCFSDLHIDVNTRYPLTVMLSDVFTVVAGDVSGNVDKSIKWIKENVVNGIVVAGNHIVYDSKKYRDLDELKTKLADAFPAGGNISFLDCSKTCSIVKSGILFIGTTLYTNYEYVSENESCSNYFTCNTPEEARRRNICIGRHCMNDFYKHVPVSPEMYYDMFLRDFTMIEHIVEQNEKSDNPLPVVIVTHHCPSPKFIVEKFEDSELNASFVSDLDAFINKHPSIKAWVAGHIHSRVFTKTESGCKLVANPRGYYMDYGYEDYLRQEKGNYTPAITEWNPEVYIDTANWNVYEEDVSGNKKVLVE